MAPWDALTNQFVQMARRSCHPWQPCHWLHPSMPSFILLSRSRPLPRELLSCFGCHLDDVDARHSLAVLRLDASSSLPSAHVETHRMSADHFLLGRHCTRSEVRRTAGASGGQFGAVGFGVLGFVRVWSSP